MTNLSNLRLLSAIAIFSTLTGGCMVHAQASANAEADAPVVYESRPTLVAVGSGVWVVRASARATYYVNDSYWCYSEGVWYRSSTYAGGWVVVQTNVVPTVIVHNNHSIYVHYEGSGAVVTKPAPGNDYVAANDSPSYKHKEKDHDHDHDDLPGVGNKRKAAGEQPGEVGKGLVKEKDSPKADKHDDKKDKDDDKHPGKGKGGKKK